MNSGDSKSTSVAPTHSTITPSSLLTSSLVASSVQEDPNQLSLPGVLGDVLEIHDQVSAATSEEEFFNEAFIGDEDSVLDSASVSNLNKVETTLTGPIGDESIRGFANESAIENANTHSSISNKMDGAISISLPAALCDEKLIQEIQSIPTKMGFKIGEVADLLGIKQYVLRYWETEFDVLKPRKAVNNQRYYTKKDVENAFLIRKLLHRDRFSIEGARSAMKELKSYVKVEVKKEKDWHGYQSKIDSIETRVDHLMMGLTRLRQLLA